jgi:hypothetical protein
LLLLSYSPSTLAPLDEAGYVRLLSGALADNGIPLIYLSTFNTDLLLVVEDRFDEAMCTLQDRVKSLTTTLGNNPQARNGAIPSLQLSLRSNVLRIAALDPERIDSYSRSLIQVVLFPHLKLDTNSESEIESEETPTGTPRFLSLTYAENERTLIADEHTIATIEEKNFLGINPFQWQAIEVHEGEIAGLEKTSWLSGVLANRNIPLFYMTTFDVDYLLVKQTRVKDAMKCLEIQLNSSSEDPGLGLPDLDIDESLENR